VTAKGPAQRAILPLLRAYLAKLEPDLAIISQGTNFDGIAYTELCRSAGRPYVVISQKALDHRWPPDSDRSILREGLQAALRCYFVSQHNLRLTESQIGATLGNAELAHNPFLVSGNALPWPGAEDGAIRLACVARLETGEKGQDILLHVLARQSWCARNLSVSFFGAGVNREGLQGLAAYLGLGNVSFPGFVDDVESIWRTHHALALPSRSEGLPLALVEAMMCGRFGIVTDEGGSGEIVEDGRTGFIASAAKIGELDRTLERAWDARAKWESIGQAARAAVTARVPRDPLAAFAEKLIGHAGSRPAAR
jgi:glycosyltransferase involved in cell wall biosynthesis